MPHSALGFLLKWLREQRQLSLRQLAQLAGVDHAYVHRLETGEKESPSEQVLQKLIRVLKPGEREARLLFFLAEHPRTDVELMAFALRDDSISYEIVVSAAGAAFRGSSRPNYPRLIARIRRILKEEEDDENE